MSTPPGLIGPVGVTKPRTRAPLVWRYLMQQVVVQLPQALSRSQRTRLHLRRLGVR